MSENNAPVIETHEWEIPAYKLAAFQSKVAQANRKLERAGLDARFEVAYENFQRRSARPGENQAVVVTSAAVYEPWVRATLTGPLRLAHGHFTFVASLIPEQAGVTVHSAPGQELGGYAPKGTTECDHCGKNRNRTRLYLVRDERDDSIIQLGHSCIELYTGIAPKGLWALTFDQELAEFTEDDGLLDGGGFSSRDLGVDVDRVLAFAFAHSNGGRAYVSAQAYNDTPTVQLVRTSLFGTKLRTEEERRYFAAKAEEAAGYLADTALLDAIKASVETTSANSDYGRNLRVILDGETVSGRNLGILVSLVKVYAKAAQIEAEREANPVAKGYIGEVKERVRNIVLHLTTVREFDGNYGTTTLFIGRTADGHVVKWFASGTFPQDTGDTLNLEAATIKAHEVYEGIDTTVITRGKIAK
ncbi:hypothetical protein [Mycolicibacter kumamotonensis]|uniref:Uncharacterized protein n=1 Tax=Mycolicibacter kumamotonensis TaxID=354243 RepID=A0A1B8SL34_9MYCO|nr:hypothetical protein [Mycolicibacter kumamotonensis]OBY33438.1 hypothetical protein ACT18_00325 [Mycolicibacter kumamotonensis]